jgi:hypothetical protein
MVLPKNLILFFFKVKNKTHHELQCDAFILVLGVDADSSPCSHMPKSGLHIRTFTNFGR